MLAAATLTGCGQSTFGGKRPASWRARVTVAFQAGSGGQEQATVDAVLTPSAVIPDERAVVYGPVALRRYGLGMPAGTGSLLPGAAAQPPGPSWAILTQGGGGGTTDPERPLRLHNAFRAPGLDAAARQRVRALIAQSRVVVVWGDRAVNAVVMQWFLRGGSKPQAPVHGSFGTAASTH